MRSGRESEQACWRRGCCAGRPRGSSSATTGRRLGRQGIGDLLVKTLIEWARSGGYSQMSLWVTDVNADAQRLYERNQFVRTGAVQEVRPGELEHEMSRTL